MKPRRIGFTLAELLIALAILGVIATFTIPKVLISQQDTRNKALTKEMAGMISEAFQAEKLHNGVIGNTTAEQIMSRVNYVAEDTSAHRIDAPPNWGGEFACDAGGTSKCLHMHNGGIILFDVAESFGGTTDNNAIVFVFDPDGKVSDLKAIQLVLFYNGRLRTPCDSIPNGSATSSYGPIWTEPQLCPSWFNWN